MVPFVETNGVRVYLHPNDVAPEDFAKAAPERGRIHVLLRNQKGWLIQHPDWICPKLPKTTAGLKSNVRSHHARNLRKKMDLVEVHYALKRDDLPQK